MRSFELYLRPSYIWFHFIRLFVLRELMNLEKQYKYVALLVFKIYRRTVSYWETEQRVCSKPINYITSSRKLATLCALL